MLNMWDMWDISTCDIHEMMYRLGVTATEVVARLNRESGFLGVAGTSDSR